MSRTLLPCPGCDRHVALDASECPFCGVALPERVAPTPVAVSGSMKRAAIFAAGMALAVEAGGCASAVPLYGAPPADAGPDSGSPILDSGPTPGPDLGGPVPLYGGAPR